MNFKKAETPDTVHGRLLESAHMSGYTAQRACDELKWLLRKDRWKTVGPGYDDINDFMATMDLAEFRLVREQRQDLVKQLAAIDARQRATARLLGVNEGTVRNDLGKRTVADLSAAKSNDSVSSNSDPARTLENAAERSAADAPARPAPPTPYYEESGITIYHGDCRAILPTIRPGLIVTDPPYNVGYHYDEHDDSLSDVDYAELLGVLTPPLVLIHYPEALFPLAQRMQRAPDEIVAWVYHANTPRQWRAIAWFGLTPDLSLDSQSYRNPNDKRIRALIEKKGSADTARLYDWWEIEQVKNVSAEKWSHPCQIPTALMMRLLRVTPYDEGPIIDPFCGSGSTLVAAQELGRTAIGIESSEAYCQIAMDRLRQRTLGLVNG